MLTTPRCTLVHMPAAGRPRHEHLTGGHRDLPPLDSNGGGGRSCPECGHEGEGRLDIFDRLWQWVSRRYVAPDCPHSYDAVDPCYCNNSYHR